VSVYLYDNAIVTDLRRIISDNRIHIAPVENVFDLMAILSSDKIEMPLISLTRTGWSLSDARSHPLKFDGALAKYDNQTGTYYNIQAMQIRINYLMDVWTKHRDENDLIVRELLFYYSTRPTLKVMIPYGIDKEHNFNIFFDPEIEDNSDIVEHKNRGEYFRQTISFYTDDAYLWKSTYNKPTLVDVDGVFIRINDQVTEKVLGGDV
jgi:hypothetical protein